VVRIIEATITYPERNFPLGVSDNLSELFQFEP